MHLAIGLILLVVAFGAVFLIIQTGALQPVTGTFQGAFGSSHSSSTVSNHSAVYQEVRVQFVSTGSGLDKTMVVSLRATPIDKEGITVSGWKLKTAKGNYVIPKAANIYSPSVPGTPAEDIYMRQGSVVNLYSGKNPQESQPQAIRSGMDEWRIWLGSNFLTIPHGTVTLVDDKNKVVDEYSY